MRSLTSRKQKKTATRYTHKYTFSPHTPFCHGLERLHLQAKNLRAVRFGAGDLFSALFPRVYLSHLDLLLPLLEWANLPNPEHDPLFGIGLGHPKLALLGDAELLKSGEAAVGILRIDEAADGLGFCYVVHVLELR